MSDDELFIRLEFFGMSHLGLSLPEVGLLTPGYLLDCYDIWRQETGQAKPAQKQYIDDIFGGIR